MVAGGDARIAEVAVIADSPVPVAPCGGCRQKLAEFARDVAVTLATTRGDARERRWRTSCPGAFGPGDMAPDGALTRARSSRRSGAARPRPTGCAGSRAASRRRGIDAQAGAFAMAACLNGLGEGGRVALTHAMRDSGTVLRWDLDRPVLDKHSTGGVGDCVSLLLAPALAACGVAVP
jgi:hypothetical protein